VTRFFPQFALVLVVVAVHLMGQALNDSKDATVLQDRLIQSLRDNDTATFLSFVGSSGLVFGVDGPTLSKAQVAAELRGKKGAYCILFDSSCLARKTGRNAANGTCSVHDLLVGTKDWQAEHTVGEHHGTPQVYVIFKPDVPSCSNGKQSIEFIFTRFEHGWELVAFPYT
jgi:hypothetical protein